MCGVVLGVVSAIGLIILSPKRLAGRRRDTGTPLPFTLANPGIISIPLGFLGCSSARCSRPSGRGALLPGALRAIGDRPRRREGAARALGFRTETTREEQWRTARRSTTNSAAARAGDLPAPGRVPGAGAPLRPRRSTTGRGRLRGLLGARRRGAATGRSRGSRCSTGRTRRSPSGSWAASSTSPTTASTATWRPAAATASPSTGAGRRARSATSPTRSCCADVQRFANALKDRGIGPGDVVGIFLPMIPEVAVAMLACARIGAIHNVVFGGFSAESVRERMEFSEAKALVTVDGARRKGKTAPIKQQVDEVMATRTSRRSSSSATRRPSARWRTGRLVPRGDGGRGRGVPGRADGRRAPALHPLHVRLDGEAEGDPAHDGRLPDAGRLHAPARLRPQAGRGRLLVLRRRRLDHRALLHRLRAARQRRDVGDVRGRAGLPGQGHLVGAVRAATA